MGFPPPVGYPQVDYCRRIALRLAGNHACLEARQRAGDLCPQHFANAGHIAEMEHTWNRLNGCRDFYSLHCTGVGGGMIV